MKSEMQIAAEAERRANFKLGILVRLARYFVTVAGLVMLDFLTTGRITWSVWPVFGISLLLIMRMSKSFLYFSDLRDRMLARERDLLMRKDANERGV